MSSHFLHLFLFEMPVGRSRGGLLPARKKRKRRRKNLLRYYSCSDRALSNLTCITLDLLSSADISDWPLGRGFLRALGTIGEKRRDLLWRVCLGSIETARLQDAERKQSAYSCIRRLSSVIPSVSYFILSTIRAGRCSSPLFLL